MYFSQLSADSYQASITMSSLDTRKNNRGDASHTCKLNTTDGNARLWTLNMPTQAGDVQSYIYQYLNETWISLKESNHTLEIRQGMSAESARTILWEAPVDRVAVIASKLILAAKIGDRSLSLVDGVHRS